MPMSARSSRHHGLHGRPTALLAGVGLAAVLLVPSGVPGLPTAAAADALSLGPGVSIPAVDVPAPPDVIAGTGTRFIIGLGARGDLFTP
ncbi:MAG: hypothetical protein WAL91_02045, partial [Propionicimonas sp.]